MNSGNYSMNSRVLLVTLEFIYYTMFHIILKFFIVYFFNFLFMCNGAFHLF